MAFVVELLVIELVHHFFIARNLFPSSSVWRAEVERAACKTV